jgi:large subunit ribosomal protein L30
MKIQQYRSLIRVPEKQKKIVWGLGLRKIGDVREIVENPCTLGMVNAVPHLVKVI